VGIYTLNAESQGIRARVGIHNPNGVEMEVDTIEMSMTLGEVDLGQHSTRVGLNVHPNGTEEVSIDFPAGESASRQLAELEGGGVSSLPYSVTGRIRDSSGGTERFSQEGYLYPVPGRSGQFRGAGPKREPID
jgi:LEA14-like dessication related protein